MLFQFRWLAELLWALTLSNLNTVEPMTKLPTLSYFQQNLQNILIPDSLSKFLAAESSAAGIASGRTLVGQVVL